MLDSFLTWGLEKATPEQGKELPTTAKSDEEIARFTVDESLNEVERTILFLNSGQVIQQKHAIANLPSVIKGRGRPAWESVAVPLKAALTRLDADCQIETAQTLAQIARDRLMPAMDLQTCLLPTIVRNINKEKSEEETQAWLGALFELVPYLDKDVVKSEVLSLALSKGDMEENVNSRVICAHILGAIAPCLSREEVERSFLSKTISMCQDVEYRVRLAICLQLGAIGRMAGRDAALATILDELFELLKDEDSQVRSAALAALVSLLDLISPETRKGRVMAVLRDHMQPFDLDITVQRCIAERFGQLWLGVQQEFDADDVRLFSSAFKFLAGKADTELRLICAQQFGAVLKAASTSQPDVLTSLFNDTLMTLSSDQDEEVRLAIATQFHVAARYAGQDCVCRELTRPLVRLLRDESHRVQLALLPGITATLQCFAANDSGREKDSALDEVARALTDMEARSARDWRLHAGLAAAFPAFPQCFTSELIYDTFLPMAYRFLSNSAAATRPAAADAITCFLRYNKRDKQRADIFLRLIREFARGKGYVQRLAFADVCRHLLRRFSSRFIKEWVFDLCLELLYDPVPNVRLQVTHILPALKQTIRLPEDVDLLERLNNAISNSMTDNDRDVSVTARHINDTYKRIPVRMGGGLSVGDMSGSLVASYEAEDRRKEEEEADFCFSPDDQKEIKAEIIQLSYKKKSVDPKVVDAKSAAARRAALEAAKPNAFGVGRSASGPASMGALRQTPASDAASRGSPQSSRLTSQTPVLSAGGAKGGPQSQPVRKSETGQERPPIKSSSAANLPAAPTRLAAALTGSPRATIAAPTSAPASTRSAAATLGAAMTKPVPPLSNGAAARAALTSSVNKTTAVAGKAVSAVAAGTAVKKK
ncbi:armadillo-type protein [Haematococcus lacustris]